MGNQTSIHKVTFEDIQTIIGKERRCLLINTLPSNMQGCLIPYTISCSEEERIINTYLKEKHLPEIIIYGRNCNDNTILTKYMQLRTLGFTNVKAYPGGMFEWMLLQDTYGEDSFPTTSKELDILKFKPPRSYNPLMIENGHP